MTTRPDFCEHPRAICTARDFGEPSSAARNVSPTWAGLCSRSVGLATSDLWSSPHIHRWSVHPHYHHSAGPSGATPWRYWRRASSLSLPSSVSVIVLPCSSCSASSSKSWRNAAGRCRWYSPLAWLSVRTSFSTPPCGCPFLKDRGDSEEPRMENGGLSTDDSTTLSYKPRILAWSTESRLFFCLSGARRNPGGF